MGSADVRPLSQVVSKGSAQWQLTDLSPTEAEVAVYGLRARIKVGSTDLTHDGWRW